MPPAPPTFSTTICCFKISPKRGAMPLPTTSVGPPAANGTIIVTGRVGQLSAAVVPGVASNRAIPPVASNPVSSPPASNPTVTFVSIIPSCFHVPYVCDVLPRMSRSFILSGLELARCARTSLNSSPRDTSETTRYASGASLVDLRHRKPGAFVEKLCGDITSH